MFLVLFGLTLRPFPPVCSCHLDSLTRWRLVIAQEAARVFLLRLLGCSFVPQCAWWFLTTYEESPFKRYGHMRVLLPS